MSCSCVGSEASESKNRAYRQDGRSDSRCSCTHENEHFLRLSDMSDLALGVTSRVEACEGVFTLILLLDGNVMCFIASLEAADEDDRDLTVAIGLAGDGGLLVSNDPVAILI